MAKLNNGINLRLTAQYQKNNAKQAKSEEKKEVVEQKVDNQPKQLVANDVLNFMANKAKAQMFNQIGASIPADGAEGTTTTTTEKGPWNWTIETTKHFDKNGNLKLEVIKTYDQHGALYSIDRIEYKDGKKVSSYVEIYNKNGNVVFEETVTYDENGKAICSDQKNYDEDGNLTMKQHVDYLEDGKQEWTKEYYRADGSCNQVVKMKFDSRGQLTSEVRYFYDSDGNLVGTDVVVEEKTFNTRDDVDGKGLKVSTETLKGIDVSKEKFTNLSKIEISDGSKSANGSNNKPTLNLNPSLNPRSQNPNLKWNPDFR